MIEALAVLSFLLALQYLGHFEAKSDVRMLFWQAKGAPSVPDELSSEERASEVLKSRIVWERVSQKLSWEIPYERYQRAVELYSRRHTWNVKQELLMDILAKASSEERAIELCNLASKEFSGRCQELALERDKLFWEIELAKVQGPLEQWKFKHQADDALELEDRAVQLRQRLKLSIAAAQMKFMDAKKDGRGGKQSAQTVELLESLKEIDKALDDFWLKGVSNESVSDLEEARRVYQSKLQQSILADQNAAMNALQDSLGNLKQRLQENEGPAILKATDDLKRLKNSFRVLKEARDLSMGQMTMYCHPFREARKAKELAATVRQLAPVVLSLLILMITAIWHRRAQRLANSP